MNRILFISTNGVWSGSEELWVRSARNLIQQKYFVAYATRYQHPELDKLNGKSLVLTNAYVAKPLIKRVIERFAKVRFKSKDVLKEFIAEVNPDSILISQGNNYEALGILGLCKELGIPYITLTQLVYEHFIWAFDNTNFLEAQGAYLGAKKNYFVSHQNLQLNNFILGVELPNAEVTYNPCKLSRQDIPPFPEPGGLYAIGLVGRLDCWHKGYDILLHIGRMEKWKERPVQFNLYGDGQHRLFLQNYISTWNLSNVVLKGHSSLVNEVWKENQILLMPSRMEGQALALIEAMWCQRAAIVTNVGGAAELVEEGYSGFIAETASVVSVDAALERAWSQRSRWKEMGLNAEKGLKEKSPADAAEYFTKKLLEQLN